MLNNIHIYHLKHYFTMRPFIISRSQKDDQIAKSETTFDTTFDQKIYILQSTPVQHRKP